MFQNDKPGEANKEKVQQRFVEYFLCECVAGAKSGGTVMCSSKTHFCHDFIIVVTTHIFDKKKKEKKRFSLCLINFQLQLSVEPSRLRSNAVLKRELQLEGWKWVAAGTGAGRRRRGARRVISH